MLATTPLENGRTSPDDGLRLIEELREYQLELEMQREELRRTYKELENSKRTFENLYDFAPVAYVTLDTGNLISRANFLAAQLLNTDRGALLGRPFYGFLSPESLNPFYHHRSQCLDTLERQSCNVELTIDPENPRYVQLESIPIPDTDGNYRKIRMALVDVTDRRNAEERIRTLSQQLLTAHEDERQMISRELHDRILQELSAIKIGCRSLLQGPEEPSSDIRERVVSLSNMLQKVIDSVRNLSYELRPPHLDHGKLMDALTDLCGEFSRSSGIKVDFFSAGMAEIMLGGSALINIYRLVQEGLNNVQKHADASHVNVTVSFSHPNILLRIIDNGKGFDMEQRMASLTAEKRMGLRSMGERARLLGGAMTVTSAPMEGTRVFISLPYKEKVHGTTTAYPDCG